MANATFDVQCVLQQPATCVLCVWLDDAPPHERIERQSQSGRTAHDGSGADHHHRVTADGRRECSSCSSSSESSTFHLRRKQTPRHRCAARHASSASQLCAFFSVRAYSSQKRSRDQPLLSPAAGTCRVRRTSTTGWSHSTFATSTSSKISRRATIR